VLRGARIGLGAQAVILTRTLSILPAPVQRYWSVRIASNRGRDLPAGSTSIAIAERDREHHDAFRTPANVNPTVADEPQNAETPDNARVLKYRYRDSNPGYRRERAAS
jgi:hypothetical protein